MSPNNPHANPLSDSFKISAEESRDPVSKLVFELGKLPGIGEKTATRLAYHILKQDQAYAKALSEAVLKAKSQIHLCDRCMTFTDVTPCRICSNARRDQNVVCVVERPSDVNSIEQSGSFRGVYHVLHGVLSPLDGVGPNDLKIRELVGRIQGGQKSSDRAQEETDSIDEIIIATNPSVEGDATALYITRLLAPMGLKVTKLAHGIPVGGQLEYTDRQTIGKAIENRVEMNVE